MLKQVVHIVTTVLWRVNTWRIVLVMQFSPVSGSLKHSQLVREISFVSMESIYTYGLQPVVVRPVKKVTTFNGTQTFISISPWEGTYINLPHIIILVFQYPVALVNDLIWRVSLGAATTSRVRRLLVCCIGTFFYLNVTSAAFFDLCSFIIRCIPSRNCWIVLLYLIQRFPNWWVASRFVVGRERFLKCDFF
jgi:hypothetical protein